MGKFYNEIPEQQKAFIEKQKMFFVASAPLSADGHVNLSPKGMDCFRVLSPNRVAYMDIIGSGNETSAHILENGRITFMFCAYDGPPMILRLYGKGYSVIPGDEEWEALAQNFNLVMSTRQIIVADIDMVQTSCGYVVPYYQYGGERDTMPKWVASKGAEALETYKAEKNMQSIDGLPTGLVKGS
ncbi:pyridoxamine 5'-phosphate oxidase family protein [Mucilaginibacter gotjawali]|nr:pyridoxamine 5'-phosphate oxidase family protein [Mucilaginibacter gotjawali]BAU52797.1 Pyridoxamine 5'-phosphate oxidase [Mucilaginibacter gotjawali]